MEIIWHGYACFEIVSGAYSLVLDPYRAGTNAGFPALDLSLIHISEPTRRS